MFAAGGWDTTYALDPKEPDLATLPAGAIQRFADLDVFTDASRPNVTQYFERHAPHTAIVRGIATDGIFHNECQRRIVTGKRDDAQPDIGPSPTGIQPMYSHFIAGLLAPCGADPSAHFPTTPVFDAFIA